MRSVVAYRPRWETAALTAALMVQAMHSRRPSKISDHAGMRIAHLYTKLGPAVGCHLGHGLAGES